MIIIVINNKKRFVSELKRVLSLYDLVFLAISSMIGSGLYVLIGSVTRDIAGPSIVISYVIAAIASAFSAICYAGKNYIDCNLLNFLDKVKQSF